MAILRMSLLSTTRPFPATDSLKLFPHYFITMRQRLIDSICAMFNEYHGNAVSPDWLLELMHTSTDDVLIARLNNWRANYPEQWQRHGIYVM